jgi:hypothetical protein
MANYELWVIAFLGLMAAWFPLYLSPPHPSPSSPFTLFTPSPFPPSLLSLFTPSPHHLSTPSFSCILIDMTGADLRQLLVNKWGRSYDIQLRRTQGKIFVLVMWKYLEQVSFPMTEAEYLEHLNAVAGYLEAWGGVEQVQTFVHRTRERPRLGKAISIQLELGDRASEWILDE